jgi:hypothetical protein
MLVNKSVMEDIAVLAPFIELRQIFYGIGAV